MAVEAALNLPDAFAEAQRLLKAGQPAAAAAQCTRILSVWPHQTDTLHLLGLIAAQQARPDQALSYVRQACAAPGARAVYFSNLAEMCRRAGCLAEGEKAARQAVHMDPEQPGAWNNLGIILQESGQHAQSKACLERVLVLKPQSPEAHNNLANTCKYLRLFTDAERHWLRALEHREDYPEPHSNLANLYSEMGAYERAAYHARRAVKLSPHFADAYINLAMIDSAQGEYLKAVAVLDRLLAFAPAHATGLAAKAQALQHLDRLEEALDCARRAVAAAPDNGEAVHALGSLCQSSGDYAAARAAYARAAGLPGPAAEKAAGNNALLLMELGETEAAEAAFAAALAAYPRSPSLYFNRADLKRFTSADDPDIGAMLQLLESGAGYTENDRMLLRFALGNAFLQAGDGRRAFEHLNEGNRMKRQSFSYDATGAQRWMMSIAQSFDADMLTRAGAFRAIETELSSGPVPIFIVGVPRSGTTLVEQILASHPAIFGAGELGILKQAVEQYGAYPAQIARLDGGQIAAIGEAYVQGVQRRFGTSLAPGCGMIVDKMPANFLYAGLIRAAMPQARIIHCRRSAADTCLSCYSKLFTHEQHFTYDMTELGQFHVAYQQLMAHWRGCLPSSHFLEVQYEDVIDDLEGQARRMLAFLDLPWSPACVAFHQTKRPVRTASVNQVRQTIYRSSAGRWKRYAEHLGPLLAALGETEPLQSPNQ